MLAFFNMYQHHDERLLLPVAQELHDRGHTIMGSLSNFDAFLSATGPRALVQVADFMHYEHSEGMACTKRARYNGVPSFGLQHGFPAGFHDKGGPKGFSTSDYYCLWGPYWSEWFDCMGRLIVTGNPALDIVPEFDRDAAAERVSKALTYVMPMALMCPQLIAWEHNKFLSSRTLEGRADAFIEQALEIDWEGMWVVRPHPSDEKYSERMEQHQRIAEAIGGVLLPPSVGVNLFDLLSYAKIVVGMSTVLLEGVAFGAQAYPIGVEYLPDDMNNPDMLVEVGSAAANMADLIEDVVNGNLPA